MVIILVGLVVWCRVGCVGWVWVCCGYFMSVVFSLGVDLFNICLCMLEV